MHPSKSNLKFFYKNLFDKVSSLTLVKNISIVAERTDFQFEPDNSYSSEGKFQQNTGEFSSKYSNTFQLNQTDAYRTNLSSYEKTFVGENKNPNGFYQEDSRKVQRNLNVFYSNNSEDLQPNGLQPGSSPVLQRNQNGYYRQNVGEYQQKPNGHISVNSGLFQQNTNVGGFQQNTDEYRQIGFNKQDSRELQREPNVFYSNNSEDIQRSPNGYYGRDFSPQGPQPREILQKPNWFQPDSNTQLQRNQNGYYDQNVGEFQQKPNAHVSASSRQFEQNPIVRGFQQNQDEFMTGTNNVNSQSVNNVESEGGMKYKGTLEEMDTFCDEGSVKEAVEVLSLFEQQGINVDLPRYFRLMLVCGEALAKQEAKIIHNHLMETKHYLEVTVQNKVLEMYMKCGSISDAYELFEKMPARNLTSWDTMIVGLVENGFGEEAIDLFTEFKEAGLKPDGQMFLGVFSACAALCDINEGVLHFESMNKVYGISPSMDHYVGVVKMLGSTGYLDEALEFIEKMPFEPSIDVWETLMNLCRIHGNVELGDNCAKFVDHLDPSRLTDQSKAGLVPVKASDLAKDEKKRKLSGQNSLGLINRFQEYRAGDTSHPDNDKIYAHLRGLSAQMKEAGYIPELRFVLHDVDEESKEVALLAHSEKLASIAGFLGSSARTPLRIIKNLRVCVDCHNALKIISKLVGRQIIARDAKRFHHFENGSCSCKDFW